MATETQQQNETAAEDAKRPSAAPCYKPHYLGGRCWNGAQRDAGTVVHAVEPAHGDNMNKAACGRVPGPRSYGWSETSKPISCPKCRKRMGL